MVGFYFGDPVDSATLEAHAADLVPSSWGEQAAAGVGQALHDNWAARAWRELVLRHQTGELTSDDPLAQFEGTQAAPASGYALGAPAAAFGPPAPAAAPLPMLDAKTATERYGIPGALKFDQPIQEPVAAEQSDAKRAQLQRQDVLARGQSGLIGRVGLSGVDMLAGFLDPLNFASMFVPGLPEAKLAAAFGESVFGRVAARAVAGASQGIAGQAALLPADYLHARYADDDFTMGNALGQLAFGGLMGGALHSAIGGLTDVIGRRYARSEASAAIAGDPDLGEAATRTAVAQMAEGRPIEIEPLVDAALAERQALGEAYDQVRATSAGPANDPLVRITPEDIDGAIIERGGWNGQGDVTVKGTGYGLSKIIFKHGEGSNTDPSLQVTRDDLLAFPKVIREFEPTISGGATSSRDWRVSLPGPDGSPRTVVFADAAFTATDGQRRVITAYVQEPGRPGASRPLSQARTGAPGSSSELFRPLGDTAAGLTHRTPQGRETPAGEDIATAEPGINTPAAADAAEPITSGLDAGAPGSSSELVRPLGDTAAGLTPRTPQGRETPASAGLATRGTRSKPPRARQPVSLLHFLASRGGLARDEGGDLAALDAHKHLVPGKGMLVRKNGGMTLDRAREAAEEAGYLPPDSTIADLLDGIDEELRGRKQYSRVDEGQLQAAREDALGAQAEEHYAAEQQVRDLAEQSGVPLSNDQLVEAATKVVQGHLPQDAIGDAVTGGYGEPAAARKSALDAAGGKPDDADARASQEATDAAAAARTAPPPFDLKRVPGLEDAQDFIKRARDADALSAEDQAELKALEDEWIDAEAARRAYAQAAACIARGGTNL